MIKVYAARGFFDSSREDETHFCKMVKLEDHDSEIAKLQDRNTELKEQLRDELKYRQECLRSANIEIEKLKEQLKEHEEKGLVIYGRKIELLSERLKEAEKIIELVDELAIHSRFCDGKGLTGKCTCYVYPARQYLAKKGGE